MSNIESFEKIERAHKDSYDQAAGDLIEELIARTIARGVCWFYGGDRIVTGLYADVRFFIEMDSRSLFYVSSMHHHRPYVPIEHDRADELVALALRSARLNSHSCDAGELGAALERIRSADVPETAISKADPLPANQASLSLTSIT